MSHEEELRKDGFQSESGEIKEPCFEDKCNKYKKNCKSAEPCTNISIDFVDIKDAECVPIIANRIYDCVRTRCEQFLQHQDVNFSIDCYGEEYDEGAPIILEKIAVSYDFIGYVADEFFAKVGTDRLKFNAVPGSGFTTSEGIELFDRYVVQVPGKKCLRYKSYDKHSCGTKTRILTDQIELYAANLKIRAIGRIGCKKISAIACLEDLDEHGKETGVFALSQLTGSKSSIYGKVCLPDDSKNKSIFLEIRNEISIDCVEPNGCYTEVEYEQGNFSATIEGAILLSNTLTPTVEDKLAVFIIPSGLEYNDCKGCK